MSRSVIRAALCLCLGWAVSPAGPGVSPWIMSPAHPGAMSAGLARVLPEVHSVTVVDDYVEVRSAGISLYDLSPLQTSPFAEGRVGEFSFRLPRVPRPAAAGAHPSVPPDIVGVFANGAPVYNQFTAASYQGQNLWHFDGIAGQSVSGLLRHWITDASRHSPILGFALDGYPIYGPWAFANSDGTGGLRRMRSSYRLRSIAHRSEWPGGIALTVGQYGPDPGGAYPLGTFAEDYEYVPGAGDLDEYNGRLACTPEYPEGTYAYFLTTDSAGRLAVPYLLTQHYYGTVARPTLPEISSAGKPGQPKISLRASTLAAGSPAQLSLQVFRPDGAPVRYLEHVHEKPIHLIIVSRDLAEFGHVHPELTAGDTYDVAYTFPHGGRFRLYADFTPPGFPQRVEAFDVTVQGPLRAPVELEETARGVRVGSTTVTLSTESPLRAGEDLRLTYSPVDAASGQPIADLQPYLGAWGHFVIVDQPLTSFIHAHPQENAGISAPEHIHGAGSAPAGPPPTAIEVVTSFPHAGLYKLWAQFQREGQVIVAPFVVRVAEALPAAAPTVAIPADAVRVTIGAGGFEPARVEVPAGRPIHLAFTRDAQPNCGRQVVFPALGLTRDLPLGQTVLIDLPAAESGELRFACGMGMYHGMIVVR